MIKIGEVNLGTNIFLAPLSGCSDLPFRLIAREHGARFCFYEMVDSNSIHYGRPQTFRILKSHEKDRPIAAQLLGSDPSVMLETAQKLLTYVDVPFLDINCACPAKKVIRKKAGAYLLRDTARLYRILKGLTARLNVPVTVKIRIGYDKKDLEDIVNTAKGCEDSGVAAIFVHGRLMKQGYAGDVDYGFIKAIKDAVRVPVFGSGNVLWPEAAKRMFDETGCDGILVARGSMGNPWIFRQIEEYLKKGRYSKATTAERKKVLKKHLSYVDKYKDISKAGKIGFMRKITIWYLKGLPNAAYLRSRITSSKSLAEIADVIGKS